jgi:hypothetical protein
MSDVREYPKEAIHSCTYNEALERIQSGWKAAREGWNGKGMYIFLAVSGQFIAFNKSSGRLEPFIVMHTVGGKYVPWTCSQTDALALDWAVIP